MAKRFLRTLFSPSVLDAQERYYGRRRKIEEVTETDPLTAEEIEFIEDRDSFYMGTISETGWPYLQHRGGGEGFVRVDQSGRILFADYGGNRQMLSVGNLVANDRVCLFFMDYAAKARLKILGQATVFDIRDHPELVEQTAPRSGHSATVERVFVIDVLSFDWNCPQFITRRFNEAQVEHMVRPLRERIAELEPQLKS